MSTAPDAEASGVIEEGDGLVMAPPHTNSALECLLMLLFLVLIETIFDLLLHFGSM